ncbi:protein lin-52 homolog isoform X1 [Pseudorca crassidens]|uniref:protein lin-52 homolog isoform X1 n=1 Tax=Pseudorca crassidens TaxID=82174 RepID=UPI00352F5CCF
MGWKMASPTDGADLEASLLSFEKLDRASPDLWPEQLPGVAEFAASFKSPITSSPPKWMAEIERDDIDMLKELGSLTTANLMEKVRGLQNLAYQLGLDECTRASHCCGLPHCGAQAPDAQAQQPWLTGPATPRHAGSSRTGARTHVPCIGRQTLNHCATREAPEDFFLNQGIVWLDLANGKSL